MSKPTTPTANNDDISYRQFHLRCHKCMSCSNDK